jgi:two-component system, NtrC family, sensor kinase
MKMLFSLLVFVLLVFKGYSQTDSGSNFVQGYLLKSKAVDNELYFLWYQGEIHTLNAPDSALIYAQQGLLLARQKKFSEGEALCLLTIAKVFVNIGNYPKALETALQSLDIFERIGIQSEKAINLYFIGQIFNLQGDYRQSLSYNFRAKLIAETIDENKTLIKALSNIGHAYEQLNQLDSALLYATQSYALCNSYKDSYLIGGSTNLIADIYSKLGNLKSSMNFYHLSISYSQKINDNLTTSNIYLGIANLFKRENKPDSCLYYSKQSLSIAQSGKFALQIMNAGNFLTDYYKEKRVFDSAFAYQQLSIHAKDSLFSAQKIMQFQNISFSEQMRQQEIKEAEVRYRNKVSVYIMFGVIAVFLFIAIILWRNNRQKQKANTLLNKQKAEIEFQKTKAEVAFDELKSTQAQLVQSEKMASLGELTAGIAHEIQNPLNFVNNFSEVNAELIAEMKAEIDQGNYEDAKMIANDITENQQKINHHGKRADAIVKGMLQHSRSSTGAKEPTDINALADEYLRLAYHGLRAKDKSFNATMKTDFDQRIVHISIIPQDIGRVILNLITNAFYAVTEKKKQIGDSLLPDGQGYEPTVTVSTKKTGNRVSISVKDNGNGIPQKILDKIFQPFFTTKPTGQGTGLGLSLSYDIVKAHGGEIKAETKEGEGAAFIIVLPA